MTQLPTVGLSMLVWVFLQSTLKEEDKYICTRVEDTMGNPSGPSLSWFERTIPYTFFEDGTSDLEGLEEFDAIRQAFAQWGRLQTPTDEAPVGSPPVECTTEGRTTDLVFKEESEFSDRDRVGYDFLDTKGNENLIIFRDDRWPSVAQADSVIALTTTTFNTVTGEILDADIEFNSAAFDFAVLPDECPTYFSNRLAAKCARTDLMNTASHEIGHALGLAHTSNKDHTMYPKADPGETRKRDLHCAERNGIVFKYPAPIASFDAIPNGYCTDSTNDSCGFCSPPNQSDARLLISIISTDDATGGCAAAQAVPWAGCLLGIFCYLSFRCRRKSMPR